MGNTVSMNVGCCRRGHLFKLKIDTSDEMREEDLALSQIDTARPSKKSGGRRKQGAGQPSDGGLSSIINAKKTTQLKARKKTKDIAG